MNYNVTILGSKLHTEDLKRLLYITRWEILRIYAACGYSKIVEQVMNHYIEDNKTVKRVSDINSANVACVDVFPLEHGLFLVRHSLEYHKDY